MNDQKPSVQPIRTPQEQFRDLMQKALSSTSIWGDQGVQDSIGAAITRGLTSETLFQLEREIRRADKHGPEGPMPISAPAEPADPKTSFVDPLSGSPLDASQTEKKPNVVTGSTLSFVNVNRPEGGGWFEKAWKAANGPEQASFITMAQRKSRDWLKTVKNEGFTAEEQLEYANQIRKDWGLPPIEALGEPPKEEQMNETDGQKLLRLGAELCTHKFVTEQQIQCGCLKEMITYDDPPVTIWHFLGFHWKQDCLIGKQQNPVSIEYGKLEERNGVKIQLEENPYVAAFKDSAWMQDEIQRFSALKINHGEQSPKQCPCRTLPIDEYKAKKFPCGCGNHAITLQDEQDGRTWFYGTHHWHPECLIAYLHQVVLNLVESRRFWKDHAKASDDMWSNLHNAAVNSFREVLGRPEASVPEMIQFIEAMKKNWHDDEQEKDQLDKAIDSIREALGLEKPTEPGIVSKILIEIGAMKTERQIREARIQELENLVAQHHAWSVWRQRDEERSLVPYRYSESELYVRTMNLFGWKDAAEPFEGTGPPKLTMAHSLKRCDCQNFDQPTCGCGDHRIVIAVHDNPKMSRNRHVWHYRGQHWGANCLLLAMMKEQPRETDPEPKEDKTLLRNVFAEEKSPIQEAKISPDLPLTGMQSFSIRLARNATEHRTREERIEEGSLTRNDFRKQETGVSLDEAAKIGKILGMEPETVKQSLRDRLSHLTTHVRPTDDIPDWIKKKLDIPAIDRKYGKDWFALVPQGDGKPAIWANGRIVEGDLVPKEEPLAINPFLFPGSTALPSTEIQASHKEPPPKDGGMAVFPVARDNIMSMLELQYKAGRDKYGTVLQTWNGRDAYKDALAEYVDLGQYMTQSQLEKLSLETRLRQVEAIAIRVAQLAPEIAVPEVTELKRILEMPWPGCKYGITIGKYNWSVNPSPKQEMKEVPRDGSYDVL